MHAQLELRLYMVQNSTEIAKAAQSGGKYKLKLGKLYCLLPLVPSIVPVIDLPNKRAYIDPPVGLMDFTYEQQPLMRRAPLRGFLPSHIDRITAAERMYLAQRTCKVLRSLFEEDDDGE